MIHHLVVPPTFLTGSTPLNRIILVCTAASPLQSCDCGCAINHQQSLSSFISETIRPMHNQCCHACWWKYKTAVHNCKLDLLSWVQL